jgi:hypothetical protein
MKETSFNAVKPLPRSSHEKNNGRSRGIKGYNEAKRKKAKQRHRWAL